MASRASCGSLVGSYDTMAKLWVGCRNRGVPITSTGKAPKVRVMSPGLMAIVLRSVTTRPTLSSWYTMTEFPQNALECTPSARATGGISTSTRHRLRRSFSATPSSPALSFLGGPTAAAGGPIPLASGTASGVASAGALRFRKVAEGWKTPCTSSRVHSTGGGYHCLSIFRSPIFLRCLSLYRTYSIFTLSPCCRSLSPSAKSSRVDTGVLPIALMTEYLGTPAFASM